MTGDTGATRDIDIRTYSDALTPDDSGIWRSSSVRAVAYPDDDNAVCFQVEDGSPWFRHRNDCLASIARRFPPTGPMVEIGAGNGYVARRFIDEGFPTIALEPGVTGAWNAKHRRGIDHVICATLEDAAFRPSSVSAVGMFDVLEHIEGDRQVVDELARILCPGGLVYLTVPSPPWLFSIKDVDAQHYRRYSIAQLTRLFGDRFQIEYATYLFSCFTLPTLLMRALPYRLGLATSRSSERYAAEDAGNQSGSGMLSRWLARELQVVEAGGARTYGTSCLLVARRRSG